MNAGTGESAAMSVMARLAHGLLASSGGAADLSYGSVKNAVREAAMRDPLDTALVTVLGGSYLFYVAEKDENPKVTSFWDALVFITTCLSVGYADVFARTSAGKAIAAAVMTVGPAISSALFEAPAAERRAETDAAAANQAALLARIDALVTVLEKRPAAVTE